LGGGHIPEVIVNAIIHGFQTAQRTNTHYTHQLCERVALLSTKFTCFATELEEPMYKVSHYILQDPLKDHLYIIVQTLNADKLSC
jgi:hypothetical protein